MKLGTLALCALVGLALPAVANADLVLPPEPSATPASSPPPVDPTVQGAPGDKPPGESPEPTLPGEPTAEQAGPATSVQGPPKGGCASCRVGDPDSDRGALPLLVAVAAAAIAFMRRR